MKTYRLGSSEMFHAPGIVAWAINGAHVAKDRPAMIRVIADGWNVPRAAATKLVRQIVPYTIEDGTTVVFTA